MGSPSHLLTIPAVPELHIPQMRQADEDSLADVVLLWQGCMADGAATSPRVQELLQGLADSPPPPAGLVRHAHPPPLHPRQEHAPSLSHQKVVNPGMRQGLKARQDLPLQGAGAAGCPWPGTPAGSAAQASATEARHPVIATRHTPPTWPPAWQGEPRGLRPIFPAVPEWQRVWAE